MRSSTPSILVADDDQGILAIVSRVLQLNGFIPLTASNGAEALEMFRNVRPALVILDVRMPVKDGITVCREIRAVSETPIIMLTALEEETEVILALNEGADDYVRKPFAANELVARIRAVLRRSGGEVERPERLQAGELVMDEASRTTSVAGREITITRTEFAVLSLLVRHKNRVLTHDQVLERVWGAEYVGNHHVLQVAISRIRQKLDASGAPEIENVAGVGYRLRVT